MNLEELRSVQDTERGRSDLQPLRESFYEEAGEYIAGLKERREEAAAAADDPFSSPEVRRLTDEIETAEEVVEAVYERRLGKLVERASLAASEMTVDEEGLTAEERRLFQDLVARMEESKATVMATLDPDPPDDASVPDDASDGDESRRRPRANAGDDGDASEGVAAADLMGDGQGASADDGVRDADPAAPAVDATTTTDETPASAASEPQSGAPQRSADGPAGANGTGGRSTGSAGGAGVADGGSAGASVDTGSSTGGGASAELGLETDRVTVRMVQDVGEILGVDDRQYDLAAEDVVQLPARNADPLVERGAAERLD